MSILRMQPFVFSLAKGDQLFFAGSRGNLGVQYQNLEFWQHLLDGRFFLFDPFDAVKDVKELSSPADLPVGRLFEEFFIVLLDIGAYVFPLVWRGGKLAVSLK